MWEGRGGVSSLSADFKFASGDLTDNLNNVKQASRGNHWFTEQTGTSLLVEKGPRGPKEIQFISSTGVGVVVVGPEKIVIFFPLGTNQRGLNNMNKVG